MIQASQKRSAERQNDSKPYFDMRTAAELANPEVKLVRLFRRDVVASRRR